MSAGGVGLVVTVVLGLLSTMSTVASATKGAWGGVCIMFIMPFITAVLPIGRVEGACPEGTVWGIGLPFMNCGLPRAVARGGMLKGFQIVSPKERLVERMVDGGFVQGLRLWGRRADTRAQIR